ncbi:MAG: porin family protein [Beijerinckiaceae bacterium]
MLPPPVFSWTGAYVGINGGGIFDPNNNNQNGFFATPGGCSLAGGGCTSVPNYSTLFANGINSLGGFDNNRNRGGFLGGGQIGINYQWSPSFVFGAELDAQGVWTGNNNNNNNLGIAVVPSPAFPAQPATIIASVNRHLEYLGTARVRAGFLATPSLLIYGTGGAAYGAVRTTGAIQASIAPLVPAAPDVLPGFLSTTSGSQARVGWTAGGGIEWMFLPNWSVKGEALYYDLGRFRTAFPPVSVTSAAVAGATVGTALPVYSARERGIIARAGLNYHFFSAPPAPVVARY